MESKIDGQVKGWDKRLANELIELLQHKSDEGRWGQAMLHSDLQDVSLLSTTAHATSKTKKVYSKDSKAWPLPAPWAVAIRPLLWRDWFLSDDFLGILFEPKYDDNTNE